MHFLITGGAGFIGSHLVEACCAQGHTVRVLDNLSSGSLAHLATTPVEIIEGDITDLQMVCQAVVGCDVVIHLAAMVSAPQSLAQPELNHRVNVTGTFHVLEAARRAGLRRVVYASSAAVYGDLPGRPKHEDAPLKPLSPYGAAKAINEAYAALYHTAYGLECVGVRCMNVYGPRQNPASPYAGVLSRFGRAALRGEAITLWGDGEQTRDFVYVQDVAQSLLAIACAPFQPECAILNLGRGEAVSLNQVIALLEALTGRPLTIQRQPARPGDIRHACADIGRLRRYLGVTPPTDLKTGLAHTLAWLAAEVDEAPRPAVLTGSAANSG